MESKICIADTHEGDAKRQQEEIKTLIGHACNHTSEQILGFLARHRDFKIRDATAVRRDRK